MRILWRVVLVGIVFLVSILISLPSESRPGFLGGYWLGLTYPIQVYLNDRSSLFSSTNGWHNLGLLLGLASEVVLGFILFTLMKSEGDAPTQV